MRTSIRAACLCVLLVGAFVPIPAGAQEWDYSGTYSGIVTTNKGKSYECVALIKDNGASADITIKCAGESVGFPGTESVEGDNVKLSASVDLPIVSGSGAAVFSDKGDAVIAVGAGSGTVGINTKASGSAKGTLSRVSTTLDPNLEPNPDPLQTAGVQPVAAPVKTTPPAVEQAARILGPSETQASVSLNEEVYTLGVLVAWLVLSFLMSAIVRRGWGLLAGPSGSEPLSAILPGEEEE